MAEWRQVGQSGFDKFQGEYIWINDLWVHPEYDGSTCIRQIIEDILSKALDAKFCYFTRQKYNGRMSRLWKRENFEMLIKQMSGV